MPKGGPVSSLRMSVVFVSRISPVSTFAADLET